LAHRYFTLLAFAGILAGPALAPAAGGDVKVIKIPRRSELTPVQRLNRKGVEAVKKHDYRSAESLFYKAYLYDPADPFTLNNLGYVSELQGDLERANKFYTLAAEQGSNASIDLSNVEHLQGKPMRDALINLQDVPIRVNRTNIQAMRLLAQNRGFEAVALLKQNLPLAPQNAFTLNNLGVASEATGDLDSALRYYRAAAASNSSEPAAVTLDQAWRGRSVSEMAAASAKRLERRVRNAGPAEAQAVMLSIRGVFAVNQNDWASAREDFLRAYSLDPTSAFTLNNRGYVAERDGDLETAQFYYGKAQKANNAGSRVGFATQLSAEGQSLGVVATDSNEKVDNAIDAYGQQRRRQTGPIELTPRGGSLTPSQPNEPPKPPGQPQTPQQ
jgi:Flp pilus assembly protein TadD